MIKYTADASNDIIRIFFIEQPIYHSSIRIRIHTCKFIIIGKKFHK